MLLNSGKIEGTVISDFQTNNLGSSKNLYIWDGVNSILVRFLLPHSYSLGSKVVLNFTNCYLRSYFGNIQIDSVPNAQSLSTGVGVAYTPVTATISQILQSPSSYISKLVLLQNITLTGSGIYSGNVSMSDGSNSMSLYTFPSSTFASQFYPTNSVNVKGIVRLYNGLPQFIIRNTNDIQ